MQVVINDQREYDAAEERQKMCLALGLEAPERRHKCYGCGDKFRAKPALLRDDPQVVCPNCGPSGRVVVFD